MHYSNNLSDILKESQIRRQKLIIKNKITKFNISRKYKKIAKYKDVIVLLDDDDILENELVTILEESLSIPKGNFLFEVDINKAVSNENNFNYLKWFGDIELEKEKEFAELLNQTNYTKENLTKIWNEKVWIKNFGKVSRNLNTTVVLKSTRCITWYDIVTSQLIVSIIKDAKLSNEANSTFSLFHQILKEVKSKIPKMEVLEFLDFIEILASKNNKESENYVHLSMRSNEEQCFKNIIGTYQLLYCAICLNYDCKQHFIKESYQINFENISCYDGNSFTISYEKFLKLLINKSNLDLIFKAQEKYSKFIQSISIQNYSNNENSSYECALSQCYKTFQNIDYEISTQFTDIEMMYFSKLLRIFKFDPCVIAEHLNFFKKDNKFNCVQIISELNKIDFNELIKNMNIIDNKKKEKKKKKSVDYKTYKNIQQNLEEKSIKAYSPCYHKQNEKCDENCKCHSKGFCEKYCVCDPGCEKIFSYCTCTSNCKTLQCPCIVAGRECDPEMCLNCKDQPFINKDNFYTKLNNCINKSCRLKIFKKTAISESNVEGWGLFALEKINKNELIDEYTGELVDGAQLEIRQKRNTIEGNMYLFEINDNYSVDSRFIGNKLKYCNHSKNPKFMNANAKNVFTEGCNRICLYASRDIEKNEEIRFNYDGNDNMAEKYPWIDDYDKVEKVENKKIKSAKSPIDSPKNEIKMLNNKTERIEGEISKWKTIHDFKNTSPSNIIQIPK